jgi:hypothetical protein
LNATQVEHDRAQLLRLDFARRFTEFSNRTGTNSIQIDVGDVFATCDSIVPLLIGTACSAFNGFDRDLATNHIEQSRFF